MLSAFLKIHRWNFLEETVDLSLNDSEEFVRLNDKANHILSNISRIVSRKKKREISFLSGHCWCGQTLLLVDVLGLVNGSVAISRQVGRRQREASSWWRRQTWVTWLIRKGE